MSEHENNGLDLSRREFLAGTGALVVVTAVAPAEAQQGGTTPAITPDPAVPRSTIRVTVNGVSRQVRVEDRWSLAELLRDGLGLTGTKIGCDRGECGACTVLVDDTPVYACSNLAVWMDGREVTTVEGLATDGRLTPLQQAFVDHDAPQCGFCTSGQLMSATALLKRTPHPSRDQVKSALAGNLCRCGNYNHYVDAIIAAAGPASRSSAGGDQ